MNTFDVMPDEVDEAHADHLLVHVHGGAYVPGGGIAGTAEAIALVLGTGIRAVSIDYRMAPRHPYPAAFDDVIAVYQHLLSERSARSIATGGSSAGGGITLAAIQQLVERGVEMPAALLIGTPGADLTGREIPSRQIGVSIDIFPHWTGSSMRRPVSLQEISMSPIGESRRSTAIRRIPSDAVGIRDA